MFRAPSLIHPLTPMVLTVYDIVSPHPGEHYLTARIS